LGGSIVQAPPRARKFANSQLKETALRGRMRQGRQPLEGFYSPPLGFWGSPGAEIRLRLESFVPGSSSFLLTFEKFAITESFWLRSKFRDLFWRCVHFCAQLAIGFVAIFGVALEIFARMLPGG
jgi:hypothetical protein